MLKKQTKTKFKEKKLNFLFDEINFKFKFFLILVLLLTAIIFLIVGFYNLIGAFLVFIAIFLIEIYGLLIFLKFWKARRLIINQLLYKLESENSRSFFSFPLSVVLCSNSGTILWYNDLFKNNFEFDKEILGLNFSKIVQNQVSSFCEKKGTQIKYKNKFFKIYGTFFKSSQTYLLLCEDVSDYAVLREKYVSSRLCVVYIVIDNYREILTNRKDSEKSTIVGRVDDLIEAFVDRHDGIMQKYREDEFFIVLKQKSLEKITETKFQILQTVKTTLQNEKKCDLTLSIGVGSQTSSFAECRKFAFQALDMALGRGGDQAAVKTPFSFQFYGGSSKEYYKSSRVKARVIAKAILELVKSCGNVIVMGHKFGDLDSVGASIGLTLALRHFKPNSFVALNREQNLSKNLIQNVENEKINDLIVDLDAAVELVDYDTLLIVVDTHNFKLLDSFELYDISKSVVVIDHHRKSVDCIEDAVIFYHEPYASSTCELVCELIQQFSDEKIIDPIASQSLLAGIMLDTKNFTIKVGVRTFEAAAYLKRLGADTVAVKKLFSSSISSYQKKAKIIMNSQIYRNCAIAVSEFKTDDMRIIAPQAADELLGIAGVEASFVIFELFDRVNITARSLGKLNVQIIMEHFKGGGHQMQAACQIENLSVQSVHEALIEAIDEWLN